MKKSRSTAEWIYPSAAFTLFIILWEIGTKVFSVPEYRLPAPSAILMAFKENGMLLLEHTAVTLMEALIGFVLGVFLAAVLSFLMTNFRAVKLILYPFSVVSQTIPLVAIAPLLAVWFGFTIVPKIILSVLVVFFPATISFTEGLSSADKDYEEMMYMMNASKFQVYKKVKIPSALPYFFAGLKISATYCIMGAVISEWVGASKGLGIFLTRAMSSFRTAALFADIVIIVILSLGLFKLIEILERKTIKWKEEKV